MRFPAAKDSNGDRYDGVQSVFAAECSDGAVSQWVATRVRGAIAWHSPYLWRKDRTTRAPKGAGSARLGPSDRMKWQTSESSGAWKSAALNTCFILCAPVASRMNTYRGAPDANTSTARLGLLHLRHSMRL